MQITGFKEFKLMLKSTFIPLKVSVLSISDTRTIENDISGNLLANKVVDAGHILLKRALCNDSIYAVRAIVSNWIADEENQVIITTGGTGVTGRDGTPEAMQPLFDKTLDGFGEIFRYLSFLDIKTSSLQSRALAGVANSTYIFVLPGSKNACKLAWDQIISQQLNIQTKPCNLAQLTDRLDEK